MFRVALIGPESCGKTSFGRYLEHRYPNVTLLPEIERDYVESLDREITYEDIEEIVRLQIEQFRLFESPENPHNSSEDSSLHSQKYYLNETEDAPKRDRRETEDPLALDFSVPEAITSKIYHHNRVILFDAELIVLKVWFDVAFGHHPDYLDKEIAAHPMDCYLLFYPDLPWVVDKTRSRGSDDERLALFLRYEQEIQSLHIPYHIIRHTTRNS